MLHLSIDPPVEKISYTSKIILTGSCFTDHIGRRLADSKLQVCQNPGGILFDPFSIYRNLIEVIENKKYVPEDLFKQDDLWHSWNHHSSFSGMEQTAVLGKINADIENTHEFLRSADWMIITFGTAWQYSLIENNLPVANCHKVPSEKFRKTLLQSAEITKCFNDLDNRLHEFNPNLKIIYTVSPVRHIKDGIVENNHSKARLLDAVHEIVSLNSHNYYFPSYELVIDVLRDYRFYNSDMIHPSEQAIDYVFDKFIGVYFNDDSKAIYDEIKKWRAMKDHRIIHPDSSAGNKFSKILAGLTTKLSSKYPFIDFSVSPFKTDHHNPT